MARDGCNANHRGNSDQPVLDVHQQDQTVTEYVATFEWKQILERKHVINSVFPVENEI